MEELKKWLVVLTFCSIGLFSSLQQQGLAHPADGLLERGDYRAAYRELSAEAAGAENLFLRGFSQFKKQNYGQAENYFRRVVEEYPDSARETDSRYFLDRLNLYRPARRKAPEIRVLLAEENDVSGEFGDRVMVRSGGEEFYVPANENWSAAPGGSNVELSTANQSTSGEKIRFIPAGGNLQFGGTNYRGEFLLLNREGRVLVINELPLDEYLYGVIKKEIAPGWPLAPVKAQTVAARSFALYYLQRNREEPYDLGATWLSQVYGGKDAETEQVLEAVRRTRGEVLVYRGRVVPGYFHANSGGYIETAEDIWEGTRTEYIEPGPDTWSLQAQHAFWQEEISRPEINKALSAEGLPGIDRLDSLKITRRLPSGRASKFSYRCRDGRIHTVRADKFRLALGPEYLRSTWIDEIEPISGGIRFSGKGWGHGIGMSQWGAYRMGEMGRDYREILEFYYSNAKIMGNYGFSQAE